jgi:hypothetical protein
MNGVTGVRKKDNDKMIMQNRTQKENELEKKKYESRSTKYNTTHLDMKNPHMYEHTDPHIHAQVHPHIHTRAHFSSTYSPSDTLR